MAVKSLSLTLAVSVAFSVTLTAVSGMDGECGAVEVAAAGSVVPDRDVRYADRETLPDWKRDWDRARHLYRQGRVDQALVQYEILLRNKPTIDEARWEYVALLMQKKRWPQAARSLDLLLTRHPDNRKFLAARARVYLAAGDAAQAVRLYGQLYEEDPSGSFGRQILEGYVEALGLSGNRRAQFLLLQQLLIRRPGETKLLLEAARTALELNRPETAVDMLQRANRPGPFQADVLRLLARTEEQHGRIKKAGRHWQELIGLVPDDLQANQALVRYYLGQNNPRMALKHLEKVIRLDPGRADTLLAAARLHQRLDQPGQALDYYGLYLQLQPDDKTARRERTACRRQLAGSLLSLVENGGACQLWEDLSQITDDRQGVYSEMASLLEQAGKTAARAAVLDVLCRQAPDACAQSGQR